MFRLECVLQSCKYTMTMTTHSISILCLILPLLVSGACGTYSHRCGKNVNFRAQKHTIIRTEDSVANGAIVLRTLHTTSAKNCEMNCCRLQECTVAVFETTRKNLCYLFNCGKDARLCEFEHHARYTASVKKNKVDKHSARSGLNVRIISQNMPPTMSTVLKHPVRTHQASTVRSQTHLVAMQSTPWQRQGHQCRYMPDVQFRCLDAKKMPNCVAIYDRCDGVPQCGDSSDEADCPHVATSSDSKNRHKSVASISHQATAGRVYDTSHLQSAVTRTNANNRPWAKPSVTPHVSDTIYNLDESDDLVDSNSVPSSASSVVGVKRIPAATMAPDKFKQHEPATTPVDSVALAESYQQVRAAVLVLGVSLVITLSAIIVLGYRLQRLRARIGRGLGGKLRARSVDDEDYLINGMYL